MSIVRQQGGDLQAKVRQAAQVPTGPIYLEIINRTTISDQTEAKTSDSRITFRVRDEIEKDLKRTNTCERVQTSQGQDELRRVLLAVAYCLPEISYCQGMNFIASVLIAVTDSEEKAFEVFMYMLLVLEMKPIFLPGVPELHLKNFQIAQLIKFHMPKFFNHLRSVQMTPDYFTSKWFMTIFSCFLPIDVVTPIFDMFIYEGWRSVFKVGIALLRYLEQQLLEMDMTDMSSYFREKVRTEGVANKFQLFMRASRVRVNTILIHNKELEKLREKFYIIQAQIKLETQQDSWPQDQKDVLIKAKTELQHLEPHTKEDIAKFQEKLRKIDKDLERHSKVMVNVNLDYIAIREEYLTAIDKLKAYEITYKELSELLKQKSQGKQWNLKQFLNKKAETTKDNQNNCYILPNDRLFEESEQQRQLQSDLKDLYEKLAAVKAQCTMLKPDYKTKKRAYADAKDKVEELLQYKIKVKDQMVGFLKIYEVKKEATLQELSHKLQESDTFQKQNVF